MATEECPESSSSHVCVCVSEFDISITLLRWTKCERANKRLYFHARFGGEKLLFLCSRPFLGDFIFTPVLGRGIKKDVIFSIGFSGEKIKGFLLSLPPPPPKKKKKRE